MSKKAVFGIAKSEPQAIHMADQLKAAGFTNDDVSVLFPDKQSSKDFAHEQHTKAPEGAATGGVGGAVLGGALGWMVGIGALAIPGLGVFIAAGPIMAALAGAAGGAAAGGLAGALVGMGIPEYEAKRYEGKVKDGNILLSIHTEDSAERDRAKKILENGGAEDISYTSETSVPKEQKAADLR
jgi:ActD protein